MHHLPREEGQRAAVQNCLPRDIIPLCWINFHACVLQEVLFVRCSDQQRPHLRSTRYAAWMLRDKFNLALCSVIHFAYAGRGRNALQIVWNRVFLVVQGVAYS